MDRKAFRVVGVALCAGVMASAWAGVGKMTTKPLWDLTDHGGARKVSSAAPFEAPNAVIPNSRAFTAEAKITFGEIVDAQAFTVFDQTVSETGWGLTVLRKEGWGNPVSLVCNGETYCCSYAMGRVASGSTHTFTVTARKGWMVVYMDGKLQKSFLLSVTPNLDPVRVGAPAVKRWGELKGITLEELRFWGEEEEYYAPGEPREPAAGFKGGKGWLVEMPVKPLAGKPNVFYQGDSISDGYTPPFKRVTKDRANLYHWNASFNRPGAEGIPTNKFVEVGQLAKYDHVVFNNGLHSLHWTEKTVSDDQVKASYRTLVAVYRIAAPQAQLHYLMTTPHTLKKNAEGKITGLGEKNETVLRLNRLAAEVMAEEKVDVIDAYSLFVDKLDQARGDQYHWNPPAYDLLARTLAERLGL